MVWLVSEQDMGGDDFVAVFLQALDAEHDKIYRLDLGEFGGLVDDLHLLQTIIVGGNINRFCEQLLSTGKTFLLLDNIQLRVEEGLRQASVSDIKELAQIFLDYCPELKIIARSFFPLMSQGSNPLLCAP